MQIYLDDIISGDIASPESPLVVLDQQVRLEDRMQHSHNLMVLKPISAAMLNDLGTITLDWAPNLGDLYIHRLEIIRDGKAIDLLAKGSKFEILRRETQMDQYSMNGELTATLAVEDLRVNDLLLLESSVSNKDPAMGNEVNTQTNSISDSYNIGFAEVRVSWPEDEQINWKVEGNKLTPKHIVEDGYHHLHYLMSVGEADEQPDDIPIRFANIDRVLFSSFDDWAHVSRTFAPHYQSKGLIADNSELAGLVDRIAADHQDPKASAAAALQLVQDEVRYLFLGMDGGNYIPQTIDETWKLRYGDCKAKTLLLLAILDRLDIEAAPVLVNTDSKDLVSRELPAASAFNHILVKGCLRHPPLTIYWSKPASMASNIGSMAPDKAIDWPIFRACRIINIIWKLANSSMI